MQRLESIYYSNTESKGRGVYTALDIPEKSLIEICPVIFIPKDQLPLIDRTVIYHYYFIWKDEDLALPLGYGCLYNHSETPNAEVIYDYEALEIHIQSIREIREGEEITIHYHNDPEFKGRLWFVVRS